jgi:hypothetical protein
MSKSFMKLESLIFTYYWQNFSPDFKYFFLSHMNELLELPYMVGKLDISSF